MISQPHIRNFSLKACATLFFLVLISLAAKAQNTTVNFNSDKYNLDSKATEKLDELVVYMNLHPGGKLTISGHTDSDANEAYNQALSQKRVNAVINYLQVRSDKLPEVELSALGESKHISGNSSDSEKALNRRVEISYFYPEATPEITKQEPVKGKIDDLYKQLLPDFEKHCINNSRDTFLVCSKGTIIHIPANAFHRPTEGCISVAVREATSKSDILLQNLSTQGTQGLLISGGMIEIEASDDDGELRLNKSAPVGVLFPTDNILDSAGTYYGNRDNSHQKNMNWRGNDSDNFLGSGIPAEFWTSCWKNESTRFPCQKCGMLRRIGRIDESVRGIANKRVRTENKAFRNCQRNMRKKSKKPIAQITYDCGSVYSYLDANKLKADSALFFKIYGPYFKANGIKTVAEGLKHLEEIEAKRLQAMKEKNYKDSLMRVGYNAIGIDRFGFINCDYFPGKSTDPLLTISTDLPYSQEVDCKLVFTGIRSVMYSYSVGNGEFGFKNVPKGKEVWLMALRYDGTQPYLFLKKFRIGEPVPTIEFEVLSVEEIKRRMLEVDL